MASRRQFVVAASAVAAGGCLSDVPLVSRSRPCESGNIESVEGEWPTLGGNAGRTGHTRDAGPGANAESGWCASVPSDQQWTAFPVVADGLVYACSGTESGAESWRDRLRALDAATGEEQWNARTAGRVVEAPTVADGTVLLGVGTKAETGAVQAFDARTGTERWRTEFEAEIGGTPTVSGGVAFVTDRSSAVHALSVEDGARRWKRRVGVDETTESEFGGNESGGNEVDGNGSSGSETTEDEGIPTFDVNFGWPVSVAGDRVYVARSVMFGGGFPALYALDPDSGSVRWEELTFLEGMVAATDDAVFGNFARQLAAIATNGQSRWSTKTDGVQATPPATDGSTVYVGGKRLSALDAGSGSERWTVGTNVEDAPQPVIAANAVYAFDGDDRLAVVGPDGTVRGRISGPVEVPFAVAGSALFAITGLRRLEAFVPGGSG
jgi:outer membrane protein assembly factor BamB